MDSSDGDGDAPGAGGDHEGDACAARGISHPHAENEKKPDGPVGQHTVPQSEPNDDDVALEEAMNEAARERAAQLGREHDPGRVALVCPHGHFLRLAQCQRRKTNCMACRSIIKKGMEAVECDSSQCFTVCCDCCTNRCGPDAMLRLTVAAEGVT